jgi:hypothetical protein
MFWKVLESNDLVRLVQEPDVRAQASDDTSLLNGAAVRPTKAEM